MISSYDNSLFIFHKKNLLTFLSTFRSAYDKKQTFNMNIFLIEIFAISICLNSIPAISQELDEEPRSINRRSLVGILSQCLTTNDCKSDQYCHHDGLNPLGKCHPVKQKGEKCLKDRQCRSKHCHLFHCAESEPVKDGLCVKNEHSNCIPSQFCAKKKGVYKCINRLCRGLCTKNAQCRSNKCFIFWCIWRPEHGMCEKK
jgi:hypothetical protein